MKTSQDPGVNKFGSAATKTLVKRPKVLGCTSMDQSPAKSKGRTAAVETGESMTTNITDEWGRRKRRTAENK